jgi:hypothetical protein
MEEFLVVNNFIDKATCDLLVAKLDQWHANELYLPPDNQCPNSPSFYGIFNDESNAWLDKIEKLVGKKLSPTYTYSRIYKHGEQLLPHIDRVECEYSFTLALKYDQHIWPIYLQTSEGVKEVLLDRGDILIYKGVENLHWRRKLLGDNHYQGFFHYVDQAGKYADKKYDGRKTFATTQDVMDEIVRRKNVL